MKTRPLCCVCLLVIFLQGMLFIAKSEDALVDIPRSSIFYEGQEKTLLIKGQVYKKTNNSNYQILYLKNNSVGDDKLFIYDKSFTDVPIGKYILIRGKLGFFERARNPGGFDEAQYYARQNTFGCVWCEKILEVSGEEYGFMEGLYQFRMAWKRRIVDCIGEKNGGILAAMLLGERSEMDSEMKELYQNNGISHILAISGLHISFIGLGVYRLIRKTGLSYLPAGIFAIGILTLYVMMIGLSVSAVRAYIMLALKIGADITGRVYDMLTAAMLGAAITVLYQPLYLTDGGFYMSYGAIIGICIILPLLKHCFPCRCKLFDAFYASISINILLFPITLWFFYVFPTYSVFLNMLVLPLTGPILALGILGSVLLPWISSVGELCLKICAFILEFYERACRVGNGLPFTRLVLGKPEWWEMLLYYFVLLVIVLFVSYAMKKKWKRIRYRLVWFALSFAIGVMTFHPRGKLEITMLDVGQGDGIYLRSPQGITFFIDGGSSDEYALGKYCMEPFLESQGVGALNYAFITHGDSDHYNGIEEMLTRQEMGVRIETLVLPEYYRSDNDLSALAKKARNAGVTVMAIKAGDYVKEGDFIITCLQPGENEEDLKGNAASMVLEVEYGGFSMLCTGDVEREGEELLLKKVTGTDYDVLKVAHHGSKYSTSERFLKLCTPEIALISAGENNRYGHPHEELLERLRNAACKIYNTQENGAIMLETDGNLYYSIKEYVKKGEHR